MSDESLLCPSAQPNEPGARVFGVHTAAPNHPRRLGYLTETIPVTPDLLAHSGKADAAEVLRVAAPCMNGGCRNFEHGACGLAGRIARMLDPVVGALSRCAIRPVCRWFREQGPAACVRCPQVVTHSREGSGVPIEVAYGDGASASV